MMISPLPIVTVVICTYNRVTLLEKCLSSLARQQADRATYEVVVVDNGSIDGTSQFLSSWEPLDMQFRWVVEPIAGLSNARNRGWQEAAGEYVAYIDDDAVAAEDWILSIVSFVRRHPDILAFGGPYEPFSQIPIPEWYPKENETLYLGDIERPIQVGAEWIVGLNMAIKKQALLLIHGFNENLGMKGKKVFYGEETRLVQDLFARGYQIYYVPSMKVQHLIGTHKMSLKWLFASSYASGRCSSLAFDTRRSLFSHLIGFSFSLAQMLIKTLSPERMPLKKRLYYSCAGVCAEWGALMEYFFPSMGNGAV